MIVDGRAQPTVGGVMVGQVGPEKCKKLAKEAMGASRKQQSLLPPWPLFPIVPSGSCPEFLLDYEVK